MKKVIVIDDESIQRRGLVSTTPWESCGCQVIGEADNVREAVELIRATSPHIVVTDIKMPGMTGLEMIGLLRGGCDCEFIIISGYSEFSYAKQALKLGVAHYLLKPIDDEELLAALKDTVARVEEKEKIRRMEQQLSSGRAAQEDSLFKNFGSGKPVDKYLEKALAFIGENCHQNLTVQEVAEHLHISASYFWKLFQSQMSCTFGDYLTECRIRKAIHYLADEEMKVYDIAAACGYKDTRYFSSVFKKVVGVTPTEYRMGKSGK